MSSIDHRYLAFELNLFFRLNTFVFLFHFCLAIGQSTSPHITTYLISTALNQFRDLGHLRILWLAQLSVAKNRIWWVIRPETGCYTWQVDYSKWRFGSSSEESVFIIINRIPNCLALINQWLIYVNYYIYVLYLIIKCYLN